MFYYFRGPKEGEGSTFTVYIPQAEAEKVASLTKPVTAVVSGMGETILLANDDSNLLGVQQQLLETFGYKVLAAEDGLQAVELFTAHQHDIALFITDLMMPKLGGAEAAKMIQEINPRMKIIFLTSHIDYIKQMQDLALDAVVMHQPCGVVDFSRTIRKQLDKV
ncbi:MAG: response regulator [Mariprofundus sp.]|nr:response regulator [Mariprofundus sp.]